MYYKKVTNRNHNITGQFTLFMGQGLGLVEIYYSFDVSIISLHSILLKVNKLKNLS